MRRLISLLALIACMAVPAIGSAAEPTVLGTGTRPSALVDRAGVTHVVWSRRVAVGVTSELLYRSRPPGGAWAPEQVLRVSTGFDARGPRILQDPAPSNRLIILDGDASPSPLWALTSSDGGAIWSTAVPVVTGTLLEGVSLSRNNDAVALPTEVLVNHAEGNLDFRVLSLPSALVTPTDVAAAVPVGAPDPAGEYVDPNITVDAAGAPVYAWGTVTEKFVRQGAGPVILAGPASSIDLAGGPRGVLAMTTSDAGDVTVRPLAAGALGAPVVIGFGASQPYLATDQAGRFHAVWIAAGTQLIYRRSEDGVTWTPPVNLLTGATPPFAVDLPYLAAGADGTGVAVWDETTDTGRILEVDLTTGTTPPPPPPPPPPPSCTGPQVAGVAPASGLPGALVSVTGSGFGATRGKGTVTVGGVAAQVVTWSDARVDLLLPALAAGQATVTVTQAGVSCSTGTVTVAKPRPVPPIANQIVIPLPDGRSVFFASVSVDADSAAPARILGKGTEQAFGDGIRSVLFRFGDGTTSRQSSGTHRYQRAASYPVSVTVTDRSGARGTTSSRVVVARRAVPPPANIAIPSQVVFDFGSAKLRPQSAAFLKRIAGILRQRKATRIRVIGRTDDIGPAPYNLSLSRRRAAAVKTYLVTKGRIKTRIVGTVGYGESRPLARGTTELARQRNRRVVLQIVFPRSTTRA